MELKWFPKYIVECFIKWLPIVLLPVCAGSDVIAAKCIVFTVLTIITFWQFKKKVEFWGRFLSFKSSVYLYKVK